MAKGNTKYFRINTGSAETGDIYQVLSEMAARWHERQIQCVSLFYAGFVDVYLVVSAVRWYHCSDADDPEWIGDAEDCIADHKSFRYNYRALRAKPTPERRWKGRWRTFDNPEALRAYVTAKSRAIISEKG